MIHLICNSCNKPMCPVCGWYADDEQLNQLRKTFEKLQDEMRRIAIQRRQEAWMQKH